MRKPDVSPRCLALVSLLTLTGCVGSTSSMRLYPLEGEIAEADPTLVIEATARNTTGTSGTLSFRLPDRVKCDGTWSSLTPKTVSRSKGLSLTWRKTGGEVGSGPPPSQASTPAKSMPSAQTGRACRAPS